MAQTEDIEADLVAWLRTLETLTVMLDKDAKGIVRIHPERLPQSAGLAPKAIVYHLISDTSETAAGSAGAGGGSGPAVLSVSHALFQFDCYGPDRITAQRIRHKLKTHLDAKQRGDIGEARVCAIVHAGDRSETDEPTDGSDRSRWIRQCDYRISYQRKTT